MSLAMSLRSASIGAGDAISSATMAAHAHGPSVVLRTRMRHRDLLARALTELRGQVEQHGNGLIARWAGRSVRFDYDAEGVAVAHVDGQGVTEQDAARLIRAVDDAYALQVQRQVYEKLKARAAQSGFHVESEQVNADQSISVTLAALS